MTRPDGKVLVDGVDVRDYPLEELRGKRRCRAAEGRAVQGHHPRKPASGARRMQRKKRCAPRLASAQALEIVENKEGGLDAPVEQGGQQSLRRSAPALHHCARPRQEARNPDLGRQRLRAGLRHGLKAPRRRCARCRISPRCSSSPSAPPPSATPTRSLCWTTARSAASAHTRSCWKPVRSIRRSTTLSMTRRRLK